MCGGDPNDGADSDCSASSNSNKQVLVGICAMAKKAQSKPMTEILTRLREFDYIHMIVFEEEVILKVKCSQLEWTNFNVEFFVIILCRTPLKIGQFAIAWYRFIRKVFLLKKLSNMLNWGSHTSSIICICNLIFRIDERSIRFWKVLELKFHGMLYWIAIHRIPQNVCIDSWIIFFFDKMIVPWQYPYNFLLISNVTIYLQSVAISLCNSGRIKISYFFQTN